MDGLQGYFIGRIFGVITDPIALVTAFILILLFYKLIKKNFVLKLVKVKIVQYLYRGYLIFSGSN